MVVEADTQVGRLSSLLCFTVLKLMSPTPKQIVLITRLLFLDWGNLKSFSSNCSTLNSRIRVTGTDREHTEQKYRAQPDSQTDNELHQDNEEECSMKRNFER